MFRDASQANASIGVPAPAPVDFTPAGVKYALAHKAGTTVVQAGTSAVQMMKK